MTKNDDMDNASDHRARLVVVEHRLEELSKSVGDLANTINRYVTEQSKQPRALPFKEIVMTVGACLTIMIGGLTLLDSRIDKAVELSDAKRRHEAVLTQYKVEQMQRAIPTTK